MFDDKVGRNKKEGLWWVLIYLSIRGIVAWAVCMDPDIEGNEPRGPRNLIFWDSFYPAALALEGRKSACWIWVEIDWQHLGDSRIETPKGKWKKLHVHLNKRYALLTIIKSDCLPVSRLEGSRQWPRLAGGRGGGRCPKRNHWFSLLVIGVSPPGLACITSLSVKFSAGLGSHSSFTW